jgi:hypothetical protein
MEIGTVAAGNKQRVPAAAATVALNSAMAMICGKMICGKQIRGKSWLTITSR